MTHLTKHIFSCLRPLKKVGATFWLVLLSTGAYAQRPTHIPGEGEPVNFFDSLTNIVLYIIIPLVVVMLFFLWRRHLKKKQEKEQKLRQKQRQQENNSQ